MVVLNIGESINNDTINNIIRNDISLLQTEYNDINNNKCIDNHFSNNCFFKSICDALVSLNLYNQLNRSFNTNFINDIVIVSNKGGITYNSINDRYIENNEYQYDKKICNMASFLTKESNNNGRKVGENVEYGIISMTFSYIFHILYEYKYLKNINEYNIINDNEDIIKEFLKTIPILSDNRLKDLLIAFYKNHNTRYHNIIQYLYDRIIENNYDTNIGDINIISYLNKFGIMYYKYENNIIENYIGISPILLIDIDFKLNEIINYNNYLNSYINNNYHIFHINNVIIINIISYPLNIINNISNDNNNIISYSPFGYKLKSVIYTHKEREVLVGGHFVCVSKNKMPVNHQFKYRIYLESGSELYAHYLIYENE